MNSGDVDYNTDTRTDPLSAFLRALPDRLRHKLQHHPLSPQGVADVHTALAAGATPKQLARRVAAGDAVGYYNCRNLVHQRLHRAAGHIADDTEDGGLDD